MIKDDERYRIITDQVGSVRLVVNATDGTIAQRIDYTAFGQVLADTNPGFQPFGFAGGLYDADTGLVRFGARDYDPVAGRWTAKDPALFGGMQSNLYVYSHNDPVNFLDPNGELPLLAGFFIGAGIDLGLQLVRSGGDFTQVDWSDVAVSGAFGLLSGGIGNGLKALDATKGLKIGIGVLIGAEIGVSRHLFKDAFNQIQGEPGSVTGLSILQSAGTAACSGGFGQR